MPNAFPRLDVDFWGQPEEALELPSFEKMSVRCIHSMPSLFSSRLQDLIKGASDGSLRDLLYLYRAVEKFTLSTFDNETIQKLTKGVLDLAIKCLSWPDPVDEPNQVGIVLAIRPSELDSHLYSYNNIIDCIITLVYYNMHNILI